MLFHRDIGELFYYNLLRLTVSFLPVSNRRQPVWIKFFNQNMVSNQFEEHHVVGSTQYHQLSYLFGSSMYEGGMTKRSSLRSSLRSKFVKVTLADTVGNTGILTLTKN